MTPIKLPLPSLIVSRSLLLLALLLGAGLLTLTAPRCQADRATYDPTKTMVAFPLSTPPVIDGVITDAEWLPYSSWSIRTPMTGEPLIADGIQGGTLTFGTLPADDNDLSVRIRARYDANNLYVAVQVTDSIIFTDSADPGSRNGNTWMDDGVEVYVDGANANDAAWAAGQLGGEYAITANNAYREMEAGNPGYGETAAWYAMTTLTAVGYDAEFRISMALLGNPKPGDIIGFNVAVNDDDDGGDRERQVSWCGVPQKPVTYGNLLLGPPSYSAPKVTTAPKVDGVINPAEYAGATEITLDPHRVVYSLDEGDDTWTAADQTFSFRVVHTTDAVFIGVNVIDDQIVNDTVPPGEDGNVYQDDSVELLFDAKNEGGLTVTLGAPPFNGQWMNFTANTAHSDSTSTATQPSTNFGPTSAWFAATSRTTNGYQIEFVIQKSALLDPLDGATLGFNVALNDDDNPDVPDRLQPKSYSLWSGHEFQPFTYGKLMLLGEAGSITNITITSIKVNADKLELSFTTPKPASTHAIEQTPKLPASSWTDVTNVTFSSAPGNTLVATFAKPSSSPVLYRIRLGDKPVGPTCVTTPAINSWVNTPFPNQTNTFTAQFDATPSEGAPLDVVMALSSGPKTAFGDFACLVRFQTAGIIDARNGAAYEGPATDIPFSANVSYHFRLVVNIPAQTYSVYVTPAGGTEQLVGKDFAFRDTAGTITNLNNWGAIDDSEGSAIVCNFKVVSP
jgi:Carbohydrate family 9 binding domain-like